MSAKAELTDVSRESLLDQARHVDLQMEIRQETAKSSALEKEVKRLSITVAEMQQKLYQAYNAMKSVSEEHDSKLAEKDKKHSAVLAELEIKLSEKEGECATLQSRFEAEVAELKAELRVASDRTLVKEQKSIIMLTDLEEERSKSHAFQAMLEETQRSKAQQDKLISSLEEEADRKQKLIEESEAASDLKLEELHRLRKKITDLESKNEALTKDMQRFNTSSTQTAQKSTEREEILLKMVEQQRLDFEKREVSLEEQNHVFKTRLEQESAASTSLKAQVVDSKTERDNALKELEEAKSSLIEKDLASDRLQEQMSQRISDLELERDGVVSKLEEIKACFTEKEAMLVRENEDCKVRIGNLSEQVDGLLTVKLEQAELVKQLQEEISSQIGTKADQDVLIEELNAEIQALTDSVQEQGVVKAILAENLSKHIAASQDGLLKLDELSNIVESKLNEFSAKIATSEARCLAVSKTSKCRETKLRSQLDMAFSDTAELENKVVQVAEELEKCLIREQKEREEAASKGEALDKALATCEHLRVENDEMAASLQSLREECSEHISELEGMCERISCELDDTKALLAETNVTVESLTAERDHAAKKLEKAEGSFAEQEAAMTKTKEQLEIQINNLTQQLQNASTSNRELNEELQRLRLLQDELDSKSDECSQLIRQIQTLELETTESNILSKDREAKLITENQLLQTQLKTELDERSESEAVLRHEIDRLKSDVANELTKNTKLQSNIDALSLALEENNGETARCREELDLALEEKDALYGQHNQSIQSLSQELATCKAEVAAAKAELSGATHRVIELESTHASLQKSKRELEESYEMLQQQHLASETKYADLSKTLESTAKSLHEKEERLSLVVAELDEMRSTAANVAIQIEAVKQEKDALRESFASKEDELTAETTSLREKLKEKDSQIDIVQTELSKIANEKDSLEALLKASNDKMEALSTEHKSVVQALAGRIEATQCEAAVSVAQLKANLETAERLLDQGDEECERLEGEIRDLNDQLESNQSELANAIAERDRLRSRFDDETKESNQKTVTLTDELRIIKEESCKVKAEKCELISNLNKVRVTLDEKMVEISELAAQNKTLCGTIEDLSIQLNQSQRDIKVLENIKREHLGEISLLESTKQMLANQMNHLESQSKRNADLFKAEKHDLLRTLESNTVQLAALSSQKEDLMSTVETLQSVSRSAEARVASLSAEKENLKFQVENLSMQIQLVESTSREKAAEYDSHIVQVKQQVHEPLQSKLEEVVMLKSTIEKLRQKHGSAEDSLRRQLLQSLEAREQDVAESTAMQLELESRIDEQCDTILAKDKDLLSMRSGKVKLEQIIDNHKSHVKELEHQLASEKLSFERKEKSFLDSIKEKETALSELASKRDELLTAMENLIERSLADKESLAKALDDQKRQVSSINSQKEDLENMIHQLQKNIDSLSAANESKDSEIKVLLDREAELNTALEAAKEKRERLESHRNESEALISALRSDKEKLETANSQLHAEVNQVKEEARLETQSLQSKLMEMQSVEQGLQSTVKDLGQKLVHAKSQVSLGKESFESARSQALRETTNLQNSIAAEKIKYQHLKENLETTRAASNAKESELKLILIDKEAAVVEAAEKQAELKAVIEDLKHTIDLEKAANGKLSIRLDSLSFSLRAKDEEIKLLQTTCQSSQDSLQSQLIESKQNLLRHQQMSLESESKLSSTIESLSTDVDVLRKNEGDLTKQLASVKNELQLVIEDKHRIEKERNAISSEHKAALHQLDSVNSELQSCQDELKSLEESHKEGLRSNEMLRLKLEEAMTWCDSLRADAKQKDEQLTEMEKQLRSRLGDATVQINVLRAEVERKEELLVGKERDLCSKLEEASNRSELLRDQVEKQKTLQDEMQKEIKSLVSKLESTKSSHHTYISQLDSEHQTSIECVRTEFQRELTHIHSELKSCQDDLAAEKEGSIELRQKLQEAIEWSDSLRCSIDEKQMMLRAKENEMASLSTTLELIQTSSNATVAELSAKHQASMESIKRELARSKSAHSEDVSRMELLNAQLEESTNQIRLLKLEMSEMLSALSDKENEINLLKDNLESVNLSLAEMTSSRDNAVGNLKSKLEESHEQSRLLESSVSAKEREVERLASDMKSLQESARNAQEQLMRMSALKDEELHVATRRNADLTLEVDDIRQQLNDATESLKSHQTEANEVIVENQAVISALSESKSMLEIAVDNLQAEMNQLSEISQQEKHVLESRLQTIQAEEQSLNTKLDLLKNENGHINSALQEMSNENQKKDAVIASLRSMLHRTHLDVCQLSMELSCTKGATVVYIADIKKSVESMVNDLSRYYNAKEMNYKSIIDELNEVVSRNQARCSHETEVMHSEQVAELNSQLEQKDVMLRTQHQQNKRLRSELSIARDELICSQAAVSCSKEVEASYHADRILLHQAISIILNSSSTPDVQDSVSLSSHPYERFMSFIEHELRDLCILQNFPIVVSDCSSSKPELVNQILQTMKLSALNPMPQPVDLNETSDSEQFRDFLCDIDEAKNKIIHMDTRLQQTTQSREELERLLTTEQERASLLEEVVTETASQLDSKSKLLIQAEDQHKRLQVKYEKASAEIDACQTLAQELRRIIIEKNAEIQTKQNELFELQYKLDDITARTDGPMSNSSEMNQSIRHVELADEVTRLEETILRMNQDSTNLSSMHQALVDGLENECHKLTDEIDEARDYIRSLEDIQNRLEDDVGLLKRDCEAKDRINRDLESALTILKQQKARVEEDNRLITSEVSKLTNVVVSYASCTEEFSFDNAQSPSSWYENLQYIERFIHFQHTKREASVDSEAITPITRGRGGFTEKSDMIAEFKEMQNMLKNVLASPRLTAAKHSEAKSDQGDLYYDLVNAVDQLQQLSDTFRDCQDRWKEKEVQLTSLIHDFEAKSHIQIANLELEQAWRQRLTSTVIENLERRRHCSVLRRAFQTWACQARLRKHLNIVKDMARELLQTKQKVLLLKSQFTDTASK
ncbi:hypothetical protein ACHAXN_011384 [Cyclotella atomus]